MKTKIGFGSPNKEGKETSHGAPLGEEELLKAKSKLNWNFPAFEVPSKTLRDWSEVSTKNASEYEAWSKKNLKVIKKFKLSEDLFKKKTQTSN